MEFKCYDPKRLVPILKEMGINNLDYEVCKGCVLVDIPPEYCVHPKEDFDASSVQSDLLCQHCRDTAEEDEKPIPLSANRNLGKKVAELEKIIEIASH